MIVKLLTEHHLEFLSLKGGCRGSSESSHVKMQHCWKSHERPQLLFWVLDKMLVTFTNQRIIWSDTESQDSRSPYCKI